MTSPRSRLQPDWVLNINRIVPIFQEPTSEVSNVAVLEAASPVISTHTPTIIVPSQISDIEPRPVVDERNDDIETLKKSISLDRLDAQAAEH